MPTISYASFLMHSDDGETYKSSRHLNDHKGIDPVKQALQPDDETAEIVIDECDIWIPVHHS